MSVYLLHLNQPLSGRAQHYIGFASSQANITRRLEHHRHGNGARFTQVCNERGIEYEIVRTWKNGDRHFERKLKNYKHAKLLCPVCNPEGYQNRMQEEE